MNQKLISLTTVKTVLARLAGLSLLAFSVSVVAAPPVPTLSTPVANPPAPISQSNVYFSWYSSGATSYRLVISQNSSFSGFRDVNGSSTCDSTCWTNPTTLSSASYSKNMDLAGKTYYWKVRANNSTGASSFSGYRYFTTAGTASFPAVDWNSSAYRSANKFFPAYAPKTVGGNLTYTPSSLGYAKGNCTWYAHGRLRQLGYTVSLDVMSSNANTWDNSARSAGISIDTTPTAGAIAQTDLGGGGLGHVAVVEKVNADGTLLISESSYSSTPNTSYDFLYNSRTVSKSAFQNYIHVKKP